MKNAIKIFAPASISNLNVGFDHLGVAIHGLGDEIIIGKGEEPGLKITEIRGDKRTLPLDVLQNAAGIGAYALLEHLGATQEPLEMILHKKMPIARGLGSSAASAVAGVYAVNSYLKVGLEKSELLPFAKMAEEAVSQSKVLDNLAPSLLGGMMLIQDNEKLLYKRLYAPAGLHFLLLIPDAKINTSESRMKLPESVPLKNAVQQSANFATFVAATYTSDFEAIKTCMKDLVIEETRSKSIPYFEKYKEIALDGGALGFGISGSGSTMFCMTDNSVIAENIKEKVQEFTVQNRYILDTHLTTINTEGVIKL
ncbi:MAG TPA: homoserine kinase [Saprospiraceae bacterium]|nr:homoserine kinase [Saprospiraceae bacterium]